MSKAKPDTGKKRTDWDAVERDYRTGKFTLRELAAKHGVSHQAIAKRAKVSEWTQDLGKAIAQATNARLVEELVNQEVAKGGQAVANTVLAAAEANTRVILGHRALIDRLSKRLETAEEKLVALGDTVTDIREAKTYVEGVAALVSAGKTLIDQQRRAFGLDDDDKNKGGDEIASLTDEDLDARISQHLDRLQG